MLKNNKIIFLVILIIAAFVGYNFLFKKESPTASDLAAESEQRQSGQSAIGRNLVAALSKLKSVAIDTAFFKDPIFNSLIDFNVQITPQEVGRNNPFSPIGGSVIKTGKSL